MFDAWIIDYVILRCDRIKKSGGGVTITSLLYCSDEGENAETLAVIKIDTSLGLPLNIINFYQQQSCQDFKKVERGH
ncbi:hypothetical protein Y032_0279g1188 [Ancylostoma ceylanicum]|uniref:Uncharacterized protein n=1 Tax=Ancylostoma ceylanicum TaxID=53326 RepID=A0A016S7G0_9BILA|nr:hypothetical protein Y032_0279g1188 [Ancylostoma ceylanicum]